ncbi:unnamed protein product, partial [Didymodactylos carnosus]
MPSVAPLRNTKAEEISKKLKGVERYNPHNTSLLEEYVQHQIDNRLYDFDANMALLKMYQFNPDFFQPNIVSNILLLALSNLPKPDFLLCKYLLDTQKCQQSKRLQEILHYAELLESCRFQEFWNVLDNNIIKIPGFEERIRDFICQTVSRTYQTVNRQELESALGRLSLSEFEELIQSRGWKTLTGDKDYIFIANHEENIKSRNIVEKIKFE